MGLLIITHDLGVVAEIADRVVVMQNGEIVEQGTARDVYRNPQHPYTKRLIAAAPGKGDMSTGGHSEPIFEVSGLVKTYGGFTALDRVSFDLHQGETIAVVGESGSGKSTTAKLILRLEMADAGQVHYAGRDILALSDRDLLAIRRDIQMVFQDPTQSLNPRMSVFQLISEAWVIHKGSVEKSNWHSRAGDLLVQVGLERDHLNRYPHQFSGGQRQRDRHCARLGA